MVKNPLVMQVQPLGGEDLLEEGMATHSSILAWRIPIDRGAWWIWFMGSQRVRHNWATKHCIAQNIDTDTDKEIPFSKKKKEIPFSCFLNLQKLRMILFCNGQVFPLEGMQKKIFISHLLPNDFLYGTVILAVFFIS